MNQSFRTGCNKVMARTKAVAIILGLICKLLTCCPCQAQPDLFGNDPMITIDDPDCKLQDVILRTCRAAGSRVLFDPAVMSDKVNDRFTNIRASQVMEHVSIKYGLLYERLGADTIYVTKGVRPLEARSPEVTGVAFATPAMSAPVQPAEPELTLDDLLNMPVSPGSAGVKAGTVLETASVSQVGGMPQVGDVSQVGSVPQVGGVQLAVTVLPHASEKAAADTAQAAGNQTSVVATSSKTMVLQGSIEHQTVLGTVAKGLRVGAQVDIGHLKSLTPGNVWSRLPNWAGGTWKTVTMTAYYRYNYLHDSKNLLIDTFIDKATETYGWQRDSHGDLWHFVGTDFYTISEGEKDYSVDFHKIHEILQPDDRHFVVRHVATRALVDKTTRKILRVFQCESLNNCTFSQVNAIRTKSSIKEFDDNGQPVSLQKGISYETRIRPYSDWNQYKGKNMRNLFSEYLLSHGLAALVPKK